MCLCHSPGYSKWCEAECHWNGSQSLKVLDARLKLFVAHNALASVPQSVAKRFRSHPLGDHGGSKAFFLWVQQARRKHPDWYQFIHPDCDSCGCIGKSEHEENQRFFRLACLTPTMAKSMSSLVQVRGLSGPHLCPGAGAKGLSWRTVAGSGVSRLLKSEWCWMFRRMLPLLGRKGRWRLGSWGCECRGGSHRGLEQNGWIPNSALLRYSLPLSMFLLQRSHRICSLLENGEKRYVETLWFKKRNKKAAEHVFGCFW